MTLATHILVPTDFSDSAHEALSAAVRIAARTGASIELLYIWEPPSVIPIETLLSEVGATGAPRSLGEIARREAQLRLAELAASVERPPQVKISSRVEVGRPDELIVALVEQGACDLVVMGTHGRRGLGRLMMGSVAERVVRNAPVPVLTVRHESPERQSMSPRAS
jgi:nucleotide-binding universal stress UspA family protein